MFKHTDYIYEIYKEKSFTAAAKNLFVSQPALSATVKKLEADLGVKLFDRQSTPLKLTEAGEAYIKAIEDIDKIKRNFENYIVDVTSLNTGSVTVSGANFISSFVLPKIIMLFSKKYPNINIGLKESNSTNLQELLLSEEIELLVDYDFDERLYTAYPLFREHILVAVPSHLPVNQKFRHLSLSAVDIRNNKHLQPEVCAIDLAALQNECFVLLKQGNDMQFRSQAFFNEYGFKPQRVMRPDQLMTAYNMSKAGMGVSFVTDTLIQSVTAGVELVFYKLNSPLAQRTLYIGHKKNRYVSRAVQEFINTALLVYQTKN